MNAKSVSNLPVKPFRFHSSLTSAQRDGVALTLRKLGHYCYQEVGFGGEVLYTNCPASEIPIATGFGFVLSPIN